MLQVLIYVGMASFGYWAYKYVVARMAHSTPDGPCDVVIESIELDPPNGSTLPEQTPIHVTIQFRFSSPAAELGVWVRIFDNTYRSQYFGSPDRAAPGTSQVTRGAYLTEPGKLDKLTVVFKNSKSTEVFRQDIPVDYTFVRDESLDILKQDGVGSTITKVSFPHGKRTKVRKGTLFPVDVEYSVNTPNGLYSSTIPDTQRSFTYAGMCEPLIGNGKIRLGFTPGEAGSIKRVKVLLRNDAEGYVYEEFVDLDLTVTD